MKKITCDVAVIGAGPAGLAAALGAKEAGAGRVIIIERDQHLGGILQQCIHSGFGLQTFGEDLSGPEYAERFIIQVRGQNIDIMTGSMVLSLDAGRRIIAAKSGEGLLEINPKAVVLAMGCRERTRGAIALPGQRPAGVYTAGAAQRFINIDGYLPGKKIVILGSGDIGMIMARRFRLEGAQVQAVVEIMPCIGGLNRNLVQCLNDFNIPLLLNHTVTNVVGKKRVEKVSVAPLGEDGKPDFAAQFDIDCDTLLLSVGLIPENELSKQAAVELDPITGGPVVDQNFHTSQPGIFAAGNVVMVFDLVDHVSACGKQAGRAAALYAQNQLFHWNDRCARLAAATGIRCVVPQRICLGQASAEVNLYMRAANITRKAQLQIQSPEQDVLFEKQFRIARPPEMLAVTAETSAYQPGKEYSAMLQGGKTVNKSSQRHHLLCIVCPQGCEIEMTETDGKLDFAPGICRRGQDYAKQELFNPCRVLTTTVRLEGADIAMLPVRTEAPIPKEKLDLAMDQIAGIKVKAPIHAGEVIVANLADTSVNLIASRTIT